MSSSKKVLNPYKLFDQQAVINGTITSSVTDVRYIDRINLFLKASLLAIGTPFVQASADYESAENPGTWFNLPLTFTAADGSDAFEYFIDLQVSAIRRIRVGFVGSAAAGTFTAVISGRES